MEEMELTVLRYSTGHESTLGALFAEKVVDVIDEAVGDVDEKPEFLCYTLEDEHRSKKVFGETRIPAGKYKLSLREYGGFHQRYKEKFPDFHIGMLEVKDVPGFTDILIHIGNNDDDTAGCLLLGNQSHQNITGPGFIGSSTDAYKRVYKFIAGFLDSGGSVTIEYVDLA